MSLFRALFPFFNSSNEVYLDTAATSQRIDSSLVAMQQYYCEYNANVHRGSYASARLASNKYEQSREVIADFLGAKSSSEIIFTSGTTDAINMIANGLNISDLQGSEILLLESEHHANLLPWQRFAARHNLTLKKITLGSNGTFGHEELNGALASLTSNVVILAIAHVSNALGNIYPIQELCAKASEVGALSVVDGTQAAAHIAINVSTINCDFYAISGHKMYAGTGIGALYGKMTWLEKLSPIQLGGEMITHVTWDSYALQAPPGKFEAGTPNIAGAIGMAAAAEFIKTNIKQIQDHELALAKYLVNELNPLVESNKLVLLGNIGNALSGHRHGGFCPYDASKAIALLSFYAPLIHANDIAAQLATQNIALRSGHHCAMPLMQSLGLEGCARVSVGCYTTLKEIDVFVASLNQLFQEGLCIGANNSLSTQQQQNFQIISPSQCTIGMAVSEASDWNAKHRLLLLHSKSLPTLPVSARTKRTEVAGCEARVWLTLITEQNGSEQFYAYSESKVVRGILALIIEKVSQFRKTDVQLLDIKRYLSQVGLSHYFSEGRRDGIGHIIQRIHTEYLQT
ncbi:MAG: cysteine desulfurase/selenocysteine lyase [Kangiellaceae bacterium]|jgi:cysteine desulfurase/selenocysteine lyase